MTETHVGSDLLAGAGAGWSGAQADTPQNSAVQTALSTDTFQAPRLPSPAPPSRRRFFKRLVAAGVAAGAQ